MGGCMAAVGRGVKTEINEPAVGGNRLTQR